MSCDCIHVPGMHHVCLRHTCTKAADRECVYAAATLPMVAWGEQGFSCSCRLGHHDPSPLLLPAVDLHLLQPITTNSLQLELQCSCVSLTQLHCGRAESLLVAAAVDWLHNRYNRSPCQPALLLWSSAGGLLRFCCRAKRNNAACPM